MSPSQRIQEVRESSEALAEGAARITQSAERLEEAFSKYAAARDPLSAFAEVFINKRSMEQVDDDKSDS